MPTTRLDASSAILAVIDVQDQLLAALPRARDLIRDVEFLIDVAKLLTVPVLATEQYPKGLGPTTARLAGKLPQPIPGKTSFSCFGALEFHANLLGLNRRQIVVTGMETHVCILQSVLDLLEEGYAVFVPEDGVLARFALDHDSALRRMEKAGGIITTVEAIAFEWLGDAQHVQFKTISQLVRTRMKAIVS